jgi:SAM-dependent methyltransferase
MLARVSPSSRRGNRVVSSRGGLAVAFLVSWATVAGCDRRSPTQPPEVDEPAAERAVSAAPAETEREAGDDEAPVVDPDLNAPYAADKKMDGWVTRFEREGREVHDERDRIVDALLLTPGMRVADLGAGTGLFTFAVAKAVGPDGHVFAVDVQEHFLEHLRARARTQRVTNVTTVAADQRSPNLPEASVDLAFFCDVYHHVEYPRTYLANLRKALAPGGRLIVVDYARIVGKSPPWLLGHIRASPDVFREEIEQAGFRLIREETFLKENFFFEFILDDA